MWTFRIAELLKHVEPALPAGKPVGKSVLHLPFARQIVVPPSFLAEIWSEEGFGRFSCKPEKVVPELPEAEVLNEIATCEYDLRTARHAKVVQDLWHRNAVMLVEDCVMPELALEACRA